MLSLGGMDRPCGGGPVRQGEMAELKAVRLSEGVWGGQAEETTPSCGPRRPPGGPYPHRGCRHRLEDLRVVERRCLLLQRHYRGLQFRIRRESLPQSVVLCK